jgi:hypothetical protein
MKRKNSTNHCDVTETKNGISVSFKVSFNDLTLGETLALVRVLSAAESPVGKDVSDFLRNAIERSDIEQLKKLLTS